MNDNGLFIAFESTIDGLGKSTQAEELYLRLLQDGYDVILTKEPGYDEVGSQIRKLLLNKEYDLNKETELFLFNADRSFHCHKLIKPSLEQGKIVISDRYFLSTLAYQGARGWEHQILWNLHYVATDGLMPDLNIVLDGKSFKQMDKNDSFESLDNEFYKKVRFNIFEYAAITSPDTCAILSGNQDQEVLADKIYQIVNDRYIKTKGERLAKIGKMQKLS